MTSSEQFEAWCTKRGLSTDTDSDCWGQQKYKYDRIQCMWEGWQASREAVEVDLPDKQFISEDESVIPEDSDWSDGFNTALEQCAEAIRAAGIKVKGE